MTYLMPDAKPWSRWDELRQRLGNCRRMMMFARFAFTHDSTMFAVFFNCARDGGDGIIVNIVTKGVRVDTEKQIPN